MGQNSNGGKSAIFVLLLATALTGCASGNNDGQASGGDAGQKEGKESGAPVKLNLFVSGTNLPAPQEDFILQKLNKDLNMDLSFNVAAPTEYEQQLNVKIAGGSAPDIFSVSKAQLQNYVKQGILLDLDPYLDKMPNVKKMLGENDLNKTKVDGKLYGIPKRAYLPMATYWIRKDWLDKLKLGMPKTTDDFAKVVQAFTEQDPDGNGKRDTYGLTGSGIGSPDAVNAPSTFDPVFSAFGVATPGQFMIKDNQVVYSTLQPEMKDAIAYIRDLVEKGYVDPEFMSNVMTRSQEKVFQGQAGIVYLNWAEMSKDEFVKQYKAINPNAEWVQLPALTGPGGTYQGSFDIGSTGGRYAFPKQLADDPQKLDKVLAYIDYITAGPGSFLVMYGLEGVHFNLEGDKVVPTDRISETGYAFNHQLTGRDERNYLTTKFPKQQALIDFAANEPRIETYNEMIPLPADFQLADKTRFEIEELTKFVFGNRPMAQFEDYTKTLQSQYGLDAYRQAAADTLKSLGYLK
ncbi:extracellular solute-binding protein [Cohnella ginsengisoli]|uniref:Extracellular solute-binding protein n=1 Tax=Cohnella ginsengisoli TaxID=425004 RepID=A0A9X4QP48_9BACL|nr:extracellular solute-binding protein [Cohnella ginsengisoli]MDG0792320.1 extracellular solute-binding protein [Cohnella ginsengisoli]